LDPYEYLKNAGTYASKLMATLRLKFYNREYEDFIIDNIFSDTISRYIPNEAKEEEVYFETVPLMTSSGVFIIKGHETRFVPFSLASARNLF
jgi:DNA-directed RNA polymerase beta subunit